MLVRCTSNSCMWMCGDMLTPRHLARRENDSDHNTQGKVVGIAPYQLEGRWRHLLLDPFGAILSAEDERVKSADRTNRLT